MLHTRVLAVFLPAVAVAALGSAPAQAGKVIVNDAVRDAINAEATARAALLKAMGVKDGDWRISAVKVPGLRAGSVELTLPAEEKVFVTSTLIVNCDATAISRTVTLAEEITNSVTVRKSQTLDVGGELTVSGEYMGVGGSATASTNFSMTSEREQSSSLTGTVSDTIGVAFNDKGGRLTVLSVARRKGDRVSWTVRFTPNDDDMIGFTAVPATGGEVCLYDGFNYEGKKACLAAGNHGKLLKKGDGSWLSIKVPDGYSAEVFQFEGFKGPARTFDKSAPNAVHGNMMNPGGVVGSVRIKGPAKTTSLKYADIKSVLPAGAQTFSASGDLAISQTAFKNTGITTWVLSDEQLAAECASPAPGRVGTAPAAAGGKGLRERKVTEADAKRLSASARVLGK